jgi:CPA2 family monovalent cation:H+ antiporter-2
MGFNILEIILCVFFIALTVTAAFRELHLPVILGYLLVGALVGPHALGLVPDSENIKKLADFGIVFLMFTIGLEFSLPKLFSLKYPVFVLGGLQVLCTILITTSVGIFILKMTTLSALVVGSIVAMSSTAIVVKQLQDQRELHSTHGLKAMSVLLFQDLAVIPIIILIAGLAKWGQQSLGMILLWALIKGTVAIIVIFLAGRWLLKPLFRVIAKTRAIELFTLTVLLVTLTGAWLTNLLGLSFALGAFLAGLMLAETEFRHQIEVEIRPFRDILLGLFFITIGMLTDVSNWHTTWEWILLLLFALVIGKMAIIVVVARISGYTSTISLRTAAILAQGGEFGFAILTLALSDKIVPHDYGQVILAALLISIVLSPLLIRFNKKIAHLLLSTKDKPDEQQAKEKITHVAKKLKNHTIICGYGRVGQHIARMLDKIHSPYIGLDLDAELVRRASLAGECIMYGDPSHPGILNAAGLEHAKVLVISFNDLRATTKILSMVKQKYPNLPILVRCSDEHELKQLKEYGATRIIAEVFEESLTLSHHLLNLLDIPTEKITELMQEVRSKDYDLLQKVFTGAMEDYIPEEHPTVTGQLRPILIPEGAHAVNKKIEELGLKEAGIEIISIRRGEEKHMKPHGDIELNAQDIIVVYGQPENLDEIEQRLLINEL